MEKIGIKKITKLSNNKKVYDISVDVNHNFFIGETEILTHNCDFLSPTTMASLRNLMEQYSKTTRFILTANYYERIIEPIVSRCQVFEIIPPSKKDVAIHVSKILATENVKFKPDDIKILVEHTYPDIRKLINACEQESINGELRVNQQEIIDSDFRLKLVEILKEKNTKNIFKRIRQLVADSRLNDYSDVYKYLYEKIDDYATPEQIANIIIAISEGIKYDSFVVDKEINFMSVIIEMLSKLN